MRLAVANGGKWARFATGALLSMAAGLPAQAPTSTLRGVVTRVDGGRADGVDVSFHAVRVRDLAGLRAGGERIDVWRTTTDAEGQFRLEVPASLAGTCLAESEGQAGTATAIVAGPGLVRIQLAAAVHRVLEVAGAPADDVACGFEVAFEGAAPLAPRRIRIEHGRLTLPSVPGYGTVLLTPPGFVAARTGDPWLPGSGYDRERLRLRSVPRRPLAVRWAAPVGVRGAGRGPLTEVWGTSAAVWHGQLANGTPFVAGEDDALRLPELGEVRLVPTGDASGRAVLVAQVVILVDREECTFTVAEELTCRAGQAWLPTWLSPTAPHVVIVDGAAGPRLLAAEGSTLAHGVVGRVRDDGGSSIAGVTARVRRAVAAGALPEPAIEATTGRDGAFVLPVRLPPGAYEVLAAAPDGRQAHTTFVVAAADPRVELVLATGARLHGLLVDADGEPAAGVRVELLLGADEVATSFGWPERFVFTDRRGEFAFAGLTEGAAYEIACDSAAYGGVVANGATPGPGGVLLQLRAGPAPR